MLSDGGSCAIIDAPPSNSFAGRPSVSPGYADANEASGGAKYAWSNQMSLSLDRLALLAASAVALEAALGAVLSATFPALVALVALPLLLRVECAVARPTGERIGGISKLVKTARAVRGDLAACATQCDSTALHKLELVIAAAFPAAIAAAFLAKIVVVLAVATAVAPHGARALQLVVRVLFLTQRG